LILGPAFGAAADRPNLAPVSESTAAALYSFEGGRSRPCRERIEALAATMFQVFAAGRSRGNRSHWAGPRAAVCVIPRAARLQPFNSRWSGVIFLPIGADGELSLLILRSPPTRFGGIQLYYVLPVKRRADISAGPGGGGQEAGKNCFLRFPPFHRDKRCRLPLSAVSGGRGRKM